MRIQRKALLKLGYLALILILSTACDPMKFKYEEGTLASKQGAFTLKDQILHTGLNTPVEFVVPYEGDASGLSLSAKIDSHSQTLSITQGNVEVLEAANFKAKFTPAMGFRGTATFDVFAVDLYGNGTSGKVTVYVDNPITALQPAIATRAPACISCHLKSSSNFITDFGYGGDGASRDYFFGGRGDSSSFFQYYPGHGWNVGSVYGDHGSSISTILFDNPSAKFYVPKAHLPDFTGLQNLTVQQYVKAQLESESMIAKNDVTKNTEVLEKEQIYIGAPVREQILSAFNLAAGGLKYFKNGDTSPDLSGIVNINGVYKNQGVVKCDGDLGIDGSLYFENLQVETNQGCRLYVTGSVYIYGAITYVNQSPTSNMQVTSSRGIFMGLGNVMKPDNSAPCEISGWYLDTFNTVDRNTYDTSYNSSLKHRVQTLWTTPYTFYRDPRTPAEIGAALMNEASNVESRLGLQLKDATCRSEGRSVAFERVLLNAPRIQSRYNGVFRGSLIGENILMSLSQFSFTYDDVFSKVPVLPMLNSSVYLQVK